MAGCNSSRQNGPSHEFFKEGIDQLMYVPTDAYLQFVLRARTNAFYKMC